MSHPPFRPENSVERARSNSRRDTVNNKNLQNDDELRDLMPCRWCCRSYGDQCGLTLDGAY